VLVDAAPRILSEIPPKLGEYTHDELERRGVEIHVGTTLESFDGRDALLADGTRVPARTLVWAAGVRAHPALSTLSLPLDDRGRVVVDETLRVVDTPDVWSLGDCAAVPNTKTPDHFDPPTCQHALRQARRLAKNLVGEPRPYGYRMLGQVATLGRYKGIAELPGIRLRGFPGWWVARTYHLYALPTFRRKVRVVTDWTVSLFFRRDIVELSALGHQRRLGEDE
jgi:NADH:quinone reductase (non-electrogenic)